MYSHAIRRSASLRKSNVFSGTAEAPQHYQAMRAGDNTSQSDMATVDGPYGKDDAADQRAEYKRLLNPTLQGMPAMDIDTGPAESDHAHGQESEDDDDDDSDDENSFLQVAMPCSLAGLATYTYQLALRNRIHADKLERSRELDMHKYTPTFIHDSLMLPGSLSSHTNKVHSHVPLSSGNIYSPLSQGSSFDVIPRMTPALLPGFHAYVHTDTRQPCLLQSPNISDHVQGMLVFGLGKEARHLVHQHYRPCCRRIKAEIQVDVLVPVGIWDRRLVDEKWRLQRRKIWAHCWIWSNVGSGDVHFRTQEPAWTLEEYLIASTDDQPEWAIRVEETAKGDEIYSEDGCPVEMDEDEDEDEKREAAWDEPPKRVNPEEWDQVEGFGGW